MNYIQQLFAILNTSGWSQERLAREFGVSFPTLNSWVNERSQPRKKAQQAIEALYLSLVGTDGVDPTELSKARHAVQRLKLEPQRLVKDTAAVDSLTLHMTFHTNIIEGSTMTLADVEEVIFEQHVLANRTAVEQAEARNHQAALHWLLDKLASDGEHLKIDESLVLELHTRLMNGIISDAGQYRRHGVRIMGSRVPTANWQKVPEQLQELYRVFYKASTDNLGDMARLHAAFEKIHPFSDGNGRTGRLLLLAQALRIGLTPPLVVQERKRAYYRYLEIAQTTGDHQLLELFIAQSMQFCHQLLRP